MRESIPESVSKYSHDLVSSSGRGIAACLVVLAVVQGTFADSTLPMYEPFPTTYGEGDRLGATASAVVWDAGNSTGTGSPTTTSAAELQYPGLITTTSSRGVLMSVTPTSNRDRGVTLNPSQSIGAPNPSLYASFLLNVQAAPSGTRRVAYFRNSTSAGNPSAGIWMNAAAQLQVAKSDTAPDTPTTPILSAGTHLVVLRYQWTSAAAGDDVVELWLDPVDLAVGEGSVPAPTISTSAGIDVSDLQAFFISQRQSEATGTLWLDDVRIATTWAGVTPSDGPVIQYQPVITEASVDAAGVGLLGTNGLPSGAFQVLTTTNLMLPIYEWTPASTNYFDTNGNFNVTEPIAASDDYRYYTMLMGEVPPSAPTPPTILTHPANLAVLAGEDAAFDVFATGAGPLQYQWFFDTSTLLVGATATSYTVTGATTNDAGTYHVVVSNSVGSATSQVATLSVVQPPTVGTPDGYATLGAGTTGGAGGTTVTVNNFTDFEFYVDNNSAPFIILVEGTINLGGSNVRVRNDKTIIGVGTNATLVGNLKVFGNNNVIIQNLTFTNPSGVGDGDGLSLDECLNIWVDHCTFVDCDDGSADIKGGADWITVSWCKFYYTDPLNDHRFSNLIGHSDNNAAEDTGKLHVTFHHNWWAELVHERMPRVRFGRVHGYNNYYNSAGNNYCVRVALECEILMENNYFEDVNEPWQYYTLVGQTPGKIFASGNEFDNVTGLIPATDVLSVDPNGLNPPPYAYTPDLATDIPADVTGGAGAGNGPFAP